ncbi:microcystin-dependent protein [Spirosoma lacussanchae]|uniref:phage tail protein n=1 Tax=Spirosoma lacussanchae TaxID=1884249 RepID=UPI0011093D05|nr:tail fiber protein [Spirosoma lacussanchae]
MEDDFLGEIKLFAGSFAPLNWAFCDGSILRIRGNDALFSILGARYGGDGLTTFALPDLRGREAIGSGAGPGLSNFSLGKTGGSVTVTLTTAQIAATSVKVGNDPAQATKVTALTSAAAQPHSNVPPCLSLNFIICIRGMYPARD